MDRRDPGVTRCSREMQVGKRNITAQGCCLCGYVWRRKDEEERGLDHQLRSVVENELIVLI